MYDAATLELLSAHAGPRLADLLSRLNPTGEVARIITAQISAYMDPQSLAGKRLLDFGCGVGASSLALARLLPHTEIVGVELNAEQVRLGTVLQSHHGFRNLRFLASPAGNQLPTNMGTFDVVMLSAVYEHLLPDERRVTLPLLWSILRDGGVVFINQTPHRWFPKEHHTTNLWGVNYLPDSLAHKIARVSTRDVRTDDWPTLLRKGIRGGTERSMIEEFTSGTMTRARILQPIRFRDRAEYWFQHTSPRYRRIKRILASMFRLSESLFGTILTTHVDVAIQKVS
jgi:2-polyprenyl-3-methyl-5-hydroxy-6-metoxy-1,4-benzoquinol methylase